ncbi:MAG: methyltransferase, partial [Pseudomonadota bacterium]
LGTDPHRSVLPMILHRVRMWNTWSNLTEIVRTGVNPAAGTLRSRPLEDLEAFIGAMQVIGRDVAVKIAGLIDLSPFRRLLDVGGGSGVYTAAFLGAAPHLTAAVFDLPEVVDITRKWLSAAGLLDRVEIVPGDFHVDDLPGGYDLVLLSAIIHSNSPEGNRDLYAKAFRSLNPGGTILIRDYVMDETRTIPPEGAVFAVNMLTATRGGNSYSFGEIRDDLEAAGFKNAFMAHDGPNMEQLVRAEKPA